MLYTLEMVEKKRAPNVAIYDKIYEAVKEKAERKHIPIIKYVNDILLHNLEKEDFLEKYAPYLSVYGYNQNRITLNDTHEREVKSIDVIVENGQLKCLEDNRSDCIHCHFVWGIPEIAKLNLRKP